MSGAVGEQDILDQLRCLRCLKGSFRAESEGAPPQDGIVRCLDCGAEVRRIDDILYFDADPGCESKLRIDDAHVNGHLRERQREEEFERVHGFTHEWLRSLPFPNLTVDTTFQYKSGALGKNFFNMLEYLQLRGSERVLDLAAGCCWTSRELARLGCEVVASDIRTIKYYGLRSAEAYWEAGDPHFDRICCEFGPIPFQDQSLDIVFCQNAFQLVDDVPLVAREIYRVLKPGGRLVLSWTGAGSPLKSSAWAFDNHYPLSVYRHNLRAAGFSTRLLPITALYENIGSIVARRPLGRLPARILEHTLRALPGLSSVCARLGNPSATLIFGAPFNMIACK